jgi:hypothetical protein
LEMQGLGCNSPRFARTKDPIRSSRSEVRLLKLFRRCWEFGPEVAEPSTSPVLGAGRILVWKGVYRAESIIPSSTAFWRRRYASETLRICCHTEFPEPPSGQ